ncbi:MAG TPA: selenocysteine-specific translation elongation factor [Candidatus Limnocylindrales bacterium]
MTVVIGTAGHIDHGKTSLLRALTGIDADRLPEERRRGMTIDVGYAHLRLADGDELDFVDVPGHDRLVGNMLVGAGEIDAALLVVAADDGPRAQTIEHLELLDGLGIDVGLAAVTKIDTVEAARVAEVVERVAELLGRTTLAGSPVVPVSSTRGDGIAESLAALAAVRDRVIARRAEAPTPVPPRLAIDRVFTVRGRGLVVTGTLRGGPLSRGAGLRLEPGGPIVRVREVQVHGEAVEILDGGGRAAVNLAGTDERAPRRGDVLTTDPDVRATSDLLAVLRRPARPDDRVERDAWPPPPGSPGRLHIGTAQVDATLGRGPRAAAELPDGRWVVRLRLREAIAAAAGDRFVLRRPSPGDTLAGGVVLDPEPPVGPARRRITTTLLRELGERGGHGPLGERGARGANLVALHGVYPVGPRASESGADDSGADESSGTDESGVTDYGGWVLAQDVETALNGAVAEAVHAAGSAGVHLAELRAAIARRLRRLATVTPKVAAAVAAALVDDLVDVGAVVRDGDLVRAPDSAATGGPSPAVLAAMDRLERALDVVAPPPLGQAALAADCPPDGIRALEAAGRIVRLEADLAYAAAAFGRMETIALGLAAARPLVPADLRDATGTSRKYVMAVIEELDRRGVLRRTPDGHVAGPRAPR